MASRSLLLLTLGASLLGCPASAQVAASLRPTGRWTAKDPGAAPTPPMGWSSWNAFRTEINEDKVIGSALKLVSSGLARKGYTYVNVDDGWWLKRRQGDGRLIVRSQIFPSAAAPAGGETSLRPFTDRIHALGLKAGLYTDVGRNACSQAYDLQSPNLPSGSAAEREVGLMGHVDQDVRLFFGEWGFDYLKVDACGLADYAAEQPYVAAQGYRSMVPLVVRGEPARTDAQRVRSMYQQVADAIGRYAAGRALLSICVWGQADVRAWGKEVGNAWRTSEDITPSWTSMLQSFDSTSTRALYAHPGAWNDPDMLFVGSGEFDRDHLIEARSHFSLWAIMAAPLVIGFDLRDAPRALLDIWGNDAAIAINQDRDGNQGTLAYRSDDVDIVVKTLADGRKAVAVLNRTAQAAKATLTADHLVMATGSEITLQDVWEHGSSSRFSDSLELALVPHETRLFIATGRHALSNGYYLSERPGSVNVAADGVRQSELDPTIHRGVSPWVGTKGGSERPMYTGWGGAQADTSPYGTTISIAGQTFARGIGVLAGSRMEVRNDRAAARFVAKVGVDDASRNRNVAVRFSVYGDGRKMFEERKKFGDKPTVVDIDVSGVKTIELVTMELTNHSSSVSTAWASAALRSRR